MFLDDSPIQGEQDDLLNRSEFAKRIGQAISYVEARAEAERYRLETLRNTATNPFSSVLNGNRCSYSENGVKYYTLMKEWLEEGLEASGFSNQTCKDLIKEAEAAQEQMNDYDSRVRGLIETVGYKAK